MCIRDSLYTAPTAIRALMAEGDKAIEGTDRSSLRILGSVGEPINPAAWEWYWKKLGNEKCPVVDTWWQTETGGFMITPLPLSLIHIFQRQPSGDQPEFTAGSAGDAGRIHLPF